MFNKSSLSSILRIAEMHSTSLHVGIRGAPLSFRPLLMPCLFLCHTSGLKLFPGGRILLRPSSNAGLHSRYLLQPSTNDRFPALAPECIRAPTLDYVSELQRWTVYPSSNAEIYPSSNAELCPGSNAGLYPRCHITLVQKSLKEFSRA